MAKLSKKEQEALEALQAKAEAPERDTSNTRLNFSIDLGDEAQVARAAKLGLIDLGEDDDDDDKDKDDDDSDPPRRGGFFPD